MTLTLLEAGEMAVRPAMIATQDAIRSDINLYPGGITWADVEYDQREGRVLQPITQDLRGIPLGMDMQQDSRAMLSSAFFLNKLSMPPAGQGGMSPLETSERIKEYIRDALPLFEPMEQEYNGGLCEDTFTALLNSGVFGPISDIPDELRGQNIRFRFTSPLHDALERKKAATYIEAGQLIAESMKLDPTAPLIVDTRVALRDALKGIGVPAAWNRSIAEVEELAEEMEGRLDTADTMELATAGGAAVEQAGKAGESVKQLTQAA
jgi:hypothetical protein